MTSRNYPEKTCAICGETFTPTGGRARYCGSCQPAKQIDAERDLPARNPWTRKQEAVVCRKCGAAPGRQCVTATGTFAPSPHKARFDDAGGTSQDDTRKSRQLEWRQRYSAANRERVFAHYGTACACCGATEDLCIDHIRGGGTEHRKEIGSGAFKFYAWLIKNNFPEGFQTLCMLCNGSKMTGDRCRIHDDQGGGPRKSKSICLRVDLLTWYERYAAANGKSLHGSFIAALVEFRNLHADDPSAEQVKAPNPLGNTRNRGHAA